jgi:hypothetical protein
VAARRAVVFFALALAGPAFAACDAGVLARSTDHG